MPSTYQPPVATMRFLLEHVLDFDAQMAALPGLEEVTSELAAEVLTMAGRMCAERLAPLNLPGDAAGTQLVDGQVVTAPGFADAYAEFVEAGWPGLAGDPEYGGQGLPRTVQIMLDEMVSAANLSFGLFPGLTRGAAEALAAHGSNDLKATYLGKLVTGEWCGAMALTEASAGTDLGLLRTRAEPREDGSYAVTGTKIFISSGDQDFGNNIVHLVLARLPDAPAGVKGISLFLVPKFLPGAAGAFDERNAMSVGALEHKMGIHAQPTCVMNYDGATGWLVGEAGRGLNAMFTMMNAERLFVGIQGLGLADAATQNAVAYARERLQGRASDGRPGTVPIIAHADVRKMLLSCRAFVEPARALAAWTAIRMDVSDHHPDAQVRAAAAADVALLTPVIKAAFTDFGFETTVQAQQVFGGHGYIHEAGMEQFVRDARITQIYEGTNGVQAMDLVSRKVTLDGGAPLRSYLAAITVDLDRADGELAGHELVIAMRRALTMLEEASDTVAAAAGEADALGAAATEYLNLFALVSLGWMWVRILKAAPALEDARLQDTYKALAGYYAAYVLPRAALHAARIAAGPATVMALDEALF
ncbi:acyl-CoA dehydrogenase [Novosphingobium guangzhouense]|uniref:Acyl-CoA dehydrogenase n=1 Tax=Novosphingobium guangzhouense TaxID=1850347 RepID=A0A2K2G6D8_9SPHN|nr:acyl-CoA dehydrogenase [Novosphingobium guangzhouense]PNU06589.1 acyl-CoA dehydrogenase [Novosphingobium guangzhouense]